MKRQIIRQDEEMSSVKIRKSTWRRLKREVIDLGVSMQEFASNAIEAKLDEVSGKPVIIPKRKQAGG